MSRRKRQKTGMINNEKENNSMTQEPQTPQQTVDEQQMVIPQESERIQRAEWIHEQVKLQREAEGYGSASDDAHILLGRKPEAFEHLIK